MAVLDAYDDLAALARAMRVLGVVDDLPERLVVAVAGISGVIRCSACGLRRRRSTPRARSSRPEDVSLTVELGDGLHC